MLELLEKRIGQAPPINSVGLSSHEAKTRLAHNGENRLAQKKRNSAAKIFAGQFHDVMVLILMAATVISASGGIRRCDTDTADSYNQRISRIFSGVPL